MASSVTTATGKISGCKFSKNYFMSKDDDCGGAIGLFDINVKISNCNFTDNYGFTTISDDLLFGGCIYATGSVLYISSSTFKGSFFLESAVYTPTNVTFTGGALHIQYSEAQFESVYFNSNIVYVDSCFRILGAAVSLSKAKSTFKRCYFYNNLAKSKSVNNEIRGSSIYTQFSNLYLENSDFKNNSSYLSGTDATVLGCIVNLLSIIDIRGCTFTNNSVQSPSYRKYSKIYGGAFYISESNGTISNCVFQNNLIYTEKYNINDKTNLKGVHSFGGASYIYKSQINFQNCKFINNSSIAYGYNETVESGAIYALRSDIQLLICIFDHNFVLSKLHSKGTYGGAFSFDYSTIIIKSTIFQDNYISCLGQIDDINNLGGSLCAFYSKYDINNCTFSSNSLTISKKGGGGAGGSIFFQESDGTIIKSSFSTNKIIGLVDYTYIHGGAISLYHTLATIDDCTFTDNVGHSANDVYIQDSKSKYAYSSLTTIKNCKFNQNYKPADYTQYFICYRIYDITNMYYQFLNNKIILKNSELNKIDVFVIFSDAVKCKYQNNCISPYNRLYFASKNAPFYNENGYSLDFEDAFNLDCFPTATPSKSRSPSKSMSPSKSRTPTKSKSPTRSLTPTSSNIFSKSFEFSESNKFSFSIYFKQTDYFTFSMMFSESFYFSLSKAFSSSQLFTESLKISKSNEFIKTSFFTSSDVFSESNEFIKTSFFTSSDVFSESNGFISSNIFSNSQQFSNSKLFTKSKTFTNSKKFTDSPNFSNSNKFTHSHVFSSSSTFINLTSSNSFSDSNYFTYIETPTPFPKDATLFMSLSISYSYVKTVTYSVSHDYSNLYIMSYIPELETYSFILTKSSYNYYFPYVILSLSPSYVPTYLAAKMQPRKKITQQNLIGIVCGCVAGVFIILSLIVFIIKRKNKIRKFIESESLVSSSDESSNIESFDGITVTNSNFENDVGWI